LIGQPFFVGGLTQPAQDFGVKTDGYQLSRFITLVGRPTRRMRESWLSDSSAMSEKLIFFRFIELSLFPARSPGTDDPGDFLIVLAPYRIRDNQNSAGTAFR